PPRTKSDALAFAIALRLTRDIDRSTGLQDAIYVEKIGRLLPTYSISSRTDDAVVLGYWLTGGANVSVRSSRRLTQMLGWLSASDVQELVSAAGLAEAEARLVDLGGTQSERIAEGQKSRGRQAKQIFELPGRP